MHVWVCVCVCVFVVWKGTLQKQEKFHDLVFLVIRHRQQKGAFLVWWEWQTVDLLPRMAPSPYVCACFGGYLVCSETVPRWPVKVMCHLASFCRERLCGWQSAYIMTFAPTVVYVWSVVCMAHCHAADISHAVKQWSTVNSILQSYAYLETPVVHCKQCSIFLNQNDMLI